MNQACGNAYHYSKGGGNLTCVPRQDFPGGRGARKKLKVRGKVKGSDPGFPKIIDFKAFLVHDNALKVRELTVRELKVREYHF